jgi:CBS domain-containing protein
MNELLQRTNARLTLRAETAAELMTPNPWSIRANATVKEAMAMLSDRGVSAAPVIDEAGRPVGVVSNSDLIVHERERLDCLERRPEFYDPETLRTPQGERLPERGFQTVQVDRTLVKDVMTPIVFSVPPEASAAKVVEEMRSLHVHRLFVVDHEGVLIGVVSTVDILNHLR